ncbi:MAG: hypothetical protein PF961_17025 [Planctomycetota bacterium]|jgi:hypothetical protein|nr:hypothetical protein [Planctomycetota bacterium]
MPESSDTDTEFEDPLMSTQEIIASARRPVLVARHRELVEDMESNVTDSLVTGSSDHPRLKSMLEELDMDSEQTRIHGTLETLASEASYTGMTLREALVEECCLLRENRGIEVARLQLHIIGVFRKLRELLESQHGLIPDLEDLRTLQASRIGRLLNPMPIEFGSPQIGDCLVITCRQSDKALGAIKTMSRGTGGDKNWVEAAGNPALPREVEEPLRQLEPAAREQARAKLVATKIRSRFFKKVFLQYFNCDELSPEEIDAHQTIFHWLECIRETPHLYPFMQGQTAEQKTWRLSRLLRKIVQLNEIYQRVTRASAHPTYAERFADMSTRERLSVMVKEHFPAAKVDDDFLVQTMLCPFAVFATWVQNKVGNEEFVLPPDPK